MFNSIVHIKKAFSYFLDSDKYQFFKINYKKNSYLLKQQRMIPYKRKRILAICDFFDHPLTADISHFIVHAEVERRRLGLEQMDIVFVINHDLKDKLIVSDDYKHLVYNFAIEFTRLFDFIGSVIVLDNRNMAIDYINNMKKSYYCIYPYGYNPNQPFERLLGYEKNFFAGNNFIKFLHQDSSLNCLKPPKDKIELARKWIKKNIYPKIPITVTLRETVENQRNSNVTEWQKLVTSYQNDERFIFIVLRDYYQLYTEDIIIGPNIIYCNEAVNSFSFRAALYQEVTLNLSVANGVGVALWLNQHTRYLQFKIITENSEIASLNKYEEADLHIGDNWYGALKNQKFVWEDDNFDVLKKETDLMLEQLKNDNLLYPKFYDENFQDKEDVLKIPLEVYQQESIVSSRTPIKYYLFAYKILTFFKKITFQHEYQSIYDINIQPNTKIVFYAASSVTKSHLSRFKGNVIAIIDKHATTLPFRHLHEVEVFEPEKLTNLKYDYIFITPILREYQIIKELKNKFHIPDNKFLVLH